ncbi:MAG: 6-phosphogluconolactonase [Myxococcaceae bacterium]|nr:6-phosphogluconolactonase [Myxococcaceae bacterium]
MMKPARFTLVCALGLAACSSSNHTSATAEDAGDAAHAVAGGDASSPASTHDGSLRDAALLDSSAEQTSPVPSIDGAVNPVDAGTLSTLSSLVYVGGYGAPYPFRTYALDRATGGLTEQQGSPQTTMGDSPTYIAASADHRFLYLANEPEAAAGSVTVAALDALGVASRLQQQPATGPLVFTSIDTSGKWLLAASYNGGFVNVFPIQSDGTLKAVADTKTFVKPANESSAQTHSIRVHPNDRFAYVPNKALNQVAQYSFDKSTGKLTALTPAVVDCAGGPRHIAFNQAGSYAFVITELSTELVAYRVADTGALTEVGRKSALPSGKTGDKGAHVLVHPTHDGFVYASNRTDNSIAVFSIASDGTPTQIQSIATGGNSPRNFDIDSAGKYLIAANEGVRHQGDGSLVVFEIGSDGRLTQRGSPVTGIEDPAAVAIVTKTAL